MSEYLLSKGPHHDPSNGRCALEWVSWIAGEEHSDRPQCVSPLLAQFCMAANDLVGNEERQRLRPYLTRCIGTANDGFDAARKRILDLGPSAYSSRGWDFVQNHFRGIHRERRKLDAILALLDQMLPTVTVELPEEAAQRAREVCEAA